MAFMLGGAYHNSPAMAVKIKKEEKNLFVKQIRQKREEEKNAQKQLEKTPLIDYEKFKRILNALKVLGNSSENREDYFYLRNETKMEIEKFLLDKIYTLYNDQKPEGNFENIFLETVNTLNDKMRSVYQQFSFDEGEKKEENNPKPLSLNDKELQEVIEFSRKMNDYQGIWIDPIVAKAFAQLKKPE